VSSLLLLRLAAAAALPIPSRHRETGHGPSDLHPAAACGPTGAWQGADGHRPGAAYSRAPVTPDGPAWPGSARSVEAGPSFFFFPPRNLFRFYSLLIVSKMHRKFCVHANDLVQNPLCSLWKYLANGTGPNPIESL
jgi:hypothetical protein